MSGWVNRWVNGSDLENDFKLTSKTLSRTLPYHSAFPLYLSIFLVCNELSLSNVPVWFYPFLSHGWMSMCEPITMTPPLLPS